jgi:hypothetical protein
MRWWWRIYLCGAVIWIACCWLVSMTGSHGFAAPAFLGLFMTIAAGHLDEQRVVLEEAPTRQSLDPLQRWALDPDDDRPAWEAIADAERE